MDQQHLKTNTDWIRLERDSPQNLWAWSDLPWWNLRKKDGWWGPGTGETTWVTVSYFPSKILYLHIEVIGVFIWWPVGGCSLHVHLSLTLFSSLSYCSRKTWLHIWWVALESPININNRVCLKDLANDSKVPTLSHMLTCFVCKPGKGNHDGPPKRPATSCCGCKLQAWLAIGGPPLGISFSGKLLLSGKILKFLDFVILLLLLSLSRAHDWQLEDHS